MLKGWANKPLQVDQSLGEETLSHYSPSFVLSKHPKCMHRYGWVGSVCHSNGGILLVNDFDAHGMMVNCHVYELAFEGVLSEV
ncbi:hypothetical protein D3C77_619070 [compost metagenome]